MKLRPNSRATEDPALARFMRYLMAERNVSPHTLSGYASDLGQLVTSVWGGDAAPPYPWREVSEREARAFVLSFAQDGSTPATMQRKLAAARSFCRFLQREETILDNPFALLRGPRKAKTLPKVLSVGEIERFLACPRRDYDEGTLDEYPFLRDTALFESLYSTGCRISEMTPVVWGEFDFWR